MSRERPACGALRCARPPSGVRKGYDNRIMAQHPSGATSHERWPPWRTVSRGTDRAGGLPSGGRQERR
eukprot:361616-Chlamydomonas_euryale.AAC.5